LLTGVIHASAGCSRRSWYSRLVPERGAPTMKIVAGALPDVLPPSDVKEGVE
jgi:hypothetical protein